MPDKTDTPLQCKIEGDELVIRIGLATLQTAAENCELFYNDEHNDAPPYIKVDDQAAFAAEVAGHLMKEGETGESILSKAIDQAFEEAVGDGCDGVDHGDPSPDDEDDEDEED